jgi:hypothetical protein
VLDYAPAYFRLGPVERRLYEIARSACVDGPYELSLDDLRLQLGYQNSLAHFRHALKAILEADAIPDYRVILFDAPPSGEKLPPRPGRKTGYCQVLIEPKVMKLVGSSALA